MGKMIVSSYKEALAVIEQLLNAGYDIEVKQYTSHIVIKILD